MAKTSHAVGTGSDTPTSSQLAELHRQIGAGQVTKDRLQDFLRGGPAFVKKSNPVGTPTQPLDLNQAMKIVGQRNFFGPNQWRNRFGNDFSIPKSPAIPWSREKLESLHGEHFLFLGVPTLAKKSLNLVMLNEYITSSGHPHLDFDYWYKDEAFARAQLDLKWYLMPVNSNAMDPVTPGVFEDYGFPSAIARVTANILFYHKQHKYLDRDAWALCSDLTNVGRKVYVRGYDMSGIYIYRPTGVAKSNFGYALTRK